MHQRPIALLFVTLGLFAACSDTEPAADEDDDAAEGGAGMGGATGGGGEGASGGTGGAGTGGGAAGAGACGGEICDADETCTSCESDDLSEETQYACSPMPQPQMGEMACGSQVCIRFLQYCRADTGDCEYPATCQDFPPDCFECECLTLDPCVLDCEVDVDGAITLNVDPSCG